MRRCLCHTCCWIYPNATSLYHCCPALIAATSAVLVHQKAMTGMRGLEYKTSQRRQKAMSGETLVEEFRCAIAGSSRPEPNACTSCALIQRQLTGCVLPVSSREAEMDKDAVPLGTPEAKNIRCVNLQWMLPTVCNHITISHTSQARRKLQQRARPTAPGSSLAAERFCCWSSKRSSPHTCNTHTHTWAASSCPPPPG